MQASRLLSVSSNSPSFGSFSSAVDLAAIAARVVEEFRDQEPQSDSHRDGDDFEFAFDCPSRRFSHPIATADEIFCNGQIRPLIPYGGGIANAPVYGKGGESQPTPSPPKSNLPRRHRPALRKLMSEDRDPTSNSSSEAEEDLIGVPPETYCVWTPNQSNRGGDSRDDDLQGLSSSPSQSKIKSHSAGFSKRWKLRNLLYARSSSEGNEKLVFPAPVKKSDETNSDQREEEEPTSKVVGEEEKESEEAKRQTFGPYRKDMIGILKNVNGLSRHLHPF
ncbi:hypothetical protein EUTSA_v10005715mg [Eutrema salsugineum]|uniref:DUF1645 domain-containing protein n=1 Tax=Eutrema salsugineum TaxID=72664 RepID=V4KWA5_EUTSA|nr:uncharacterized protein LOC18011651 [Eutrema salsugineum]ESQ31638.1 hypothetical protein EUTSA_v10005715mg [Eutrema salsugineum]